MRKQQGSTEVPLSLFISYAHNDEPLRQQLDDHLSLLRRQGLIADWHDHQILAGDEWARDIDQHLEAASIILLLISPDFLASDYCYEREMQRALERHKQGKARVIPLILRPCDWKTSPFARLQCLPRNTKPIVTWGNLDEAFLAIVQELRKIIAQQRSPQPLLSGLQQQKRTRLLKQVRATWIEGFLEDPLHQAAWINLQMQVQPDALENPWRSQYQELRQTPRALPVGTSIVEVYDEADGKLLILGEPGSGKTTLLLHLVRTLLDRAEADERQPMPVVFNLSSWAQKHEPLASWLVEELKMKYRMPPKVVQGWIEANQILPLLDGLDEVAYEARVSCLQAITAYCSQHPSQIVVCCRSKEYQDLSLHLRLGRAVSIQPLTNQQIELYLDSAPGNLEGVRMLIKRDSEMRKLARTPLMLSIMALTYHDTPPKLPGTQATGSLEMRRRQIFATYVQQMLSRRGQLKSGNAEQIMHWLTWLAQRMKQQQPKIEELYLEHLQPTWLETKRAWVYTVLKILLIGLVGLGSGLLFALIFGLGAVLFSPGGLLFELRLGLDFGLVNGLILGPIVGLGGLRKLRGWLGRPQIQEIQPSDKLTWSWKPFWGTLVIAMPIALGLGFLGGRVVTLVVSLLAALLTALGVGLLRGLSDVHIDKRLKPNQGIRNSGWTALRSGLLGGGLAGLLIGLGTGLGNALFSGSIVLGGLLGGGFGLGLGLGLLIGLIYGGEAYLAHYTLRFMLWSGQHLPWDLVAFLDEATERLLLRKVGGGYIFVHRLVLDYFASLDDDLESNNTK